MKNQIDIKSALFGIAVGVLAVFAIGAGTSSNPVGKYRVSGFAGPNGPGFAFLIDTQTGEVWGCDLTKDFRDKSADKFWGAK